MRIPVQRTAAPRRPPEAVPAFGTVFTDHLFRVDWTADRGWHGARIEPYAPIALDPAAAVLHYAQEAFEGSKAFRGRDGVVRLFRPRHHARRMTRTAARLCMPDPGEELLVEAVKALVREDASWVPDGAAGSLYVRPVLFATEPFLGVRPAKAYTLLVIACPVAGYFGKDARPLRLWVERRYARAAPGGIGAAKAGANYVASLLAAEEAKARGYDQVLWTDAATHRWLEEVGTMNLFARVGDTVVTPPLGDTALAGVTRDSVLALLREEGTPVEEAPVALEDLERAHRRGELAEVFGTGTAAVVAPVSELAYDGGTIAIPPSPGGVADRLGRTIREIQRGERADRHGWMEAV